MASRLSSPIKPLAHYSTMAASHRSPGYVTRGLIPHLILSQASTPLKTPCLQPPLKTPCLQPPLPESRSAPPIAVSLFGLPPQTSEYQTRKQFQKRNVNKTFTMAKTPCQTSSQKSTHAKMVLNNKLPAPMEIFEDSFCRKGFRD